MRATCSSPVKPGHTTTTTIHFFFFFVVCVCSSSSSRGERKTVALRRGFPDFEQSKSPPQTSNLPRQSTLLPHHPFRSCDYVFALVHQVFR
jgi:hypothetical protein